MYNVSSNHLFAKTKLLNLDRSEGEDSILGFRNKRFENLIVLTTQKMIFEKSAKPLETYVEQSQKLYEIT